MKPKLKWLLIILLCSGLQVQAQFWKKLQKKVEDRVEDVVTDKIAQKASQETDKALEKMLNPNFNKNSPIPLGGKMGSLDDIPENYDFDWVYTMEIETSEADEKMDFQYRLKKDAPYFGVDMTTSAKQGKMFMVYDNSSNNTVMFMDMEGDKMATVFKNDLLDGEMEDQEDMDEYTFKKIDGKKILGYDCDGFIAENEDLKMTYYVTYDAGISFSGIYGKNQKMPKNFKPEWVEKGGQEGMMMQMIFEDKEKKKNNSSMICIRLEKEPYTISKAGYSSMGSFGQKD